jgi:pimeloyl-ACP methyl ester carboxylesterase
VRRLRKWWWVPLLILAIPLLAVGGFVVWAEMTPSPMPEGLVAMQSDSQVEVITDRWLIFRPVNQEPRTGLILYPGGRVDSRSYAPAARAIAAEGYLVIIVPMPLNLAVFGADKASEVIAAFPRTDHWGVGGHSLGGAMAARFAHGHPSEVEGLVLWAAYPDVSNDLTASDLAVTSIYGTLDGLATQDKIASSRSLLPSETQWVAIEGGNHAQFGWYGPQSGDNAATISPEAQQQQIVEATVRLLRYLSQE